MPRKRVYICGPMTGLTRNNLDAFHYAEMRLNEAGFEAVMPPGSNDGSDPEWQGLTREQAYRKVIPGDIAAVASCDYLIVLPGWSTSPGGKYELQGCDLFGVTVFGREIAYVREMGGEVPTLPAPWARIGADMKHWMDMILQEMRNAT